MKTKIKQGIISFSIFPAAIAVFLLFPQRLTAKVIINEIAWMGTDESQYGEWIELYNNDDEEVDLTGWKLSKKKGDTDALIISLTKKIRPKGYYLIERTTPSVSDPVPGADDDAGAWKENGISNSGETISLKDASDIVIDSVDGSDKWKIGGATETIGDNTKPKRTAQLIGTSWKTLPPTPKEKNEDNKDLEKDTDKEKKTEFSWSVRINELLPNPSGKDDGNEWVELFNFGSVAIDLTDWMLITASGGSAELEGALPENNFLVIPLSLRNTTDTVSLLDPVKTPASEISYKNAPDGNSLNFFKQGTYRWSKTTTPLAENILNSAPEAKKTDIPDTAYIDVPVSFSASGKDGDGEKMKYAWDFGDGHKSYKQETTHRYEKKGKYRGVLTISDGTEDIVTPFSLEVEEYEAPKVRMLSLVPNPKGKDTGAENIEIENRSKKQVDLLGWSIATGWKKLVNHPIRESFVIKAKSKRFLTREFSSFTLPNGKGKIELRSPDGKTVQKMKYDLKGKSAGENARLVKEKGKKWEWITKQSTDNSRQTTESSQQIAKSIRQKTKEQEEILQEERLKQDTEIIVLKKKRGEKLISAEKNPREEMRKLIGFGTDIETPLAVLESAPRVAGAKSEAPPPDTAIEDFDLNAIINDWLAKE